MILTGGDKPFFPVALRQDSGSWPPLTGFWDHTHWTNHIRYDSSEREISPTQKPLSYNTQHSQQTDFHVSGRIRTRNPSKRAAANPRLRRPGHRERRIKKHLEKVLSQCQVFHHKWT